MLTKLVVRNKIDPGTALSGLHLNFWSAMNNAGEDNQTVAERESLKSYSIKGKKTRASLIQLSDGSFLKF